MKWQARQCQRMMELQQFVLCSLTLEMDSGERCLLLSHQVCICNRSMLCVCVCKILGAQCTCVHIFVCVCVCMWMCITAHTNSLKSVYNLVDIGVIDIGRVAHYEFPTCSTEGEMLCHRVTITDNNFVGPTNGRLFTLKVVDSKDRLGDFVDHFITIIDDDGRLLCFYISTLAEKLFV